MEFEHASCVAAEVHEEKTVEERPPIYVGRPEQPTRAEWGFNADAEAARRLRRWWGDIDREEERHDAEARFTRQHSGG